MRTKFFLVAVALVVYSIQCWSEEDSIRIFQHCGRDGITNEWRLSSSQIRRPPKWDPLISEAPLSVSNAVRIAYNYLTTHKEIRIWEPGLRVDSLTIDSLHSDKAPFQGFFYYRLIFRNGEFDSTACIILMDGSVLESRKRVAEGNGQAVNSGQSP
jgi:hypothetical protein